MIVIHSGSGGSFYFVVPLSLPLSGSGRLVAPLLLGWGRGRLFEAAPPLPGWGAALGALGPLPLLPVVLLWSTACGWGSLPLPPRGVGGFGVCAGIGFS